MSSLIRLVQICNTHQAADGGPARNAFDLNLALNDRAEVTANLYWFAGGWVNSVGSLHAAEYGGSLPEPGPRAIRLRSARRVASVGALVDDIRHADALIIHGLFLWWVPMAVLLGAMLRTPVLLMPHGALTRYDMARGSSRKRVFLRLVSGWVGTFAVGSEDEAVELQEALPAARVNVVGVGTRVPGIVDEPSRASGMRILSISRLAPKKRIDLLIRAVGELRDRGHDVTAVIAGSGGREHVRELASLTRKLGLENRIKFAGFVSGEDKESLFSRATVFALPSEDENFGIGIAEALVRGLPTVATRNVAAAKAMGEPFVSFTQTLNPTAIADAIEKALETARPRDESAAAAASVFSWSATAGRWVGAVESLLVVSRDSDPAC